MSRTPASTNSWYHIDPLNKQSFVASDEVNFNIPSDSINFKNFILAVRMHTDIAVTTLPTQSGAAAIIRKLQFNMGGCLTDDIESYSSYYTNNLICHESFGSNTTNNSGFLSTMGRGATLGVGASNFTTFYIPLTFSMTDAGFKINTRQFAQTTTLNLTLATDAEVLTHATLAPAFTVSKCWIMYSKADPSECLNFSDGVVLNTTVVKRSIRKPSALQDNIQFSNLNTNCTRILMNFNTLTTGYTADKQESQISKITDLTFQINATQFPQQSMNVYDIGTEMYTMTQLSSNPGIRLNRMNDTFMTRADFLDDQGYLSVPLFERGRKTQKGTNGINRYLLGTKIVAGDGFNYTQAAGFVAGSVITWIEFIQKLTYSGGCFTARKQWATKQY